MAVLNEADGSDGSAGGDNKWASSKGLPVCGGGRFRGKTGGAPKYRRDSRDP